uniref:Clusterin n=1 Tax=Pelodiscus sinensis TaxID=13735 RepID=K7FAS3_PELSI
MRWLLFLLLGCLLDWGEGQALIPPNELRHLSATGSKYVAAEIENAINGVKQMKSLMDKTSKDHQEILTTLEETKKKKEQAMQLAQATEQQLTEKPEVCNETMLALWEECKPCLKQTCMRLLEEFLNRSSPLSIWVDGERMDSLLEEDTRQGRRLADLEERYSLVEDSVDGLFQESTRAYGRMGPLFRQKPVGGVRSEEGFSLGPEALSGMFCRSREQVSVDPKLIFLLEKFHSMVEPPTSHSRKQHGPWPLGLKRAQTGNSSRDPHMVCQEIRRNSAGCLKMKDKCEKCQEILSVECPEGPCTSRSSVTRADRVQKSYGFALLWPQVLAGAGGALPCAASGARPRLAPAGPGWLWPGRPWVRHAGSALTRCLLSLQVLFSLRGPSDTQVTVRLFDEDPLTLSVPGEIPWDDPKFMELVADEALKRYKQSSRVE